MDWVPAASEVTITDCMVGGQLEGLTDNAKRNWGAFVAGRLDAATQRRLPAGRYVVKGCKALLHSDAVLPPASRRSYHIGRTFRWLSALL